jgi:capsular exopolysaccharide synthesis family protein
VTTLFQYEELDVDAVLHETSIPGLRILPSGPLPASPAQLLSSPRMQALLHRLMEQADVVVVDAPPVTAAVDASILATQVDGVLLVVAMGRTRRGLAARSVKLLRQIQAHLVGIVLDSAPLKASHYSRAYDYDMRGAERTSTFSRHTQPEIHLNGASASQPAFRLRPSPPSESGAADIDAPI